MFQRVLYDLKHIVWTPKARRPNINKTSYPNSKTLDKSEPLLRHADRLYQLTGYPVNLNNEIFMESHSIFKLFRTGMFLAKISGMIRYLLNKKAQRNPLEQLLHPIQSAILHKTYLLMYQLTKPNLLLSFENI